MRRGFSVAEGGKSDRFHGIGRFADAPSAALAESGASLERRDEGLAEPGATSGKGSEPNNSSAPSGSKSTLFDAGMSDGVSVVGVRRRNRSENGWVTWFPGQQARQLPSLTSTGSGVQTSYGRDGKAPIYDSRA
jgi:hypothetical protein